MRKLLARCGAALVGLLAVAVLASPAFAHVTVTPAQATQGGFTVLTFLVPNEQDSATTTKVEVNLPADQPLASVVIKPVPGWAATSTTTKLAAPIQSDDGPVTEAVTKVTWVATGAAAIQPGQFQEFSLSVGPLPDADQMIFKVLQTYSDGTIVRWIDEPNPNGSEPAHPAPVLKLAKAAGTTTTAPATSGSDGTGTVALVLSVVALIVAIVALVVAPRLRRRSSGE
jgi:uncharacterized protein YcnI